MIEGQGAPDLHTSEAEAVGKTSVIRMASRLNHVRQQPPNKTAKQA